MRTISHDSDFSDAFTEQRHPHTSISRRSVFVLFAHFSQGPARVREQSASLNAHRPDSNPTLFVATAPTRPTPPPPTRRLSVFLTPPEGVSYQLQNATHTSLCVRCIYMTMHNSAFGVFISPGGGVLLKTKDRRQKTEDQTSPLSAETARKNPPPTPTPSSENLS